MGPDSSAETRKLRKERDDLKGAISSFETELLDIQMDTKVLADDRDNFKLLYEQVWAHCGVVGMLGSTVVRTCVRR